MKTINQVAEEADLWESRCIRMMLALTDALDGGGQAHDLETITGLPKGRCKEIVQARSDAANLLAARGLYP